VQQVRIKYNICNIVAQKCAILNLWYAVFEVLTVEKVDMFPGL